MGNAIYCRNGHFLDYAPEGDPYYDDLPVLHEWQADQVERALARLRYCPQCGAASIRECSHCKSSIDLDDQIPEKPSYCSGCGKPFPWTEAALTAAKEYTDEAEGLSAQEKTALKATFDELTGDGPRTELAANRFKRLLKKLAPDVAEGIRKTIVEIASEAAAKLLKSGT
jgi:hypothetical protein